MQLYTCKTLLCLSVMPVIASAATYLQGSATPAIASIVMASAATYLQGSAKPVIASAATYLQGSARPVFA